MRWDEVLGEVTTDADIDRPSYFRHFELHTSAARRAIALVLGWLPLNFVFKKKQQFRLIGTANLRDLLSLFTAALIMFTAFTVYSAEEWTLVRVSGWRRGKKPLDGWKNPPPYCGKNPLGNVEVFRECGKIPLSIVVIFPSHRGRIPLPGPLDPIVEEFPPHWSAESIVEEFPWPNRKIFFYQSSIMVTVQIVIYLWIFWFSCIVVKNLFDWHHFRFKNSN